MRHWSLAQNAAPIEPTLGSSGETGPVKKPRKTGGSMLAVESRVDLSQWVGVKRNPVLDYLSS